MTYTVPMSNRSEKDVLRAAYKQARTAFASADAGSAADAGPDFGAGICARADRAITDHLIASDAYRSAKTIFTYVSVGAETDTRAFIAQAFADGKTVCVPRTSGKKGAGHTDTGYTDAVHMDAVPLTPDQYHAMIETACSTTASVAAYKRNQIPEPPNDLPAMAPRRLDLILVPSLAIDSCGYRLGYGGGYYDRYIEEARKVKKDGAADTVSERPIIIAIQRSAFVTNEALPREPHDQKADAILTEAGFIFSSCQTA